MAVTTNAPTTNDVSDLDDAVAFILENSTVKTSGVREVPKAAYEKAMEKHGVTKDVLEKVQKAINHENSAAYLVAVADLEEKIASASEEDLANPTFRQDLSATVSLPTYGGKTKIEVTAEKQNRNPFWKEGDEKPQITFAHGVGRSSIDMKQRISKAAAEAGRQRIRTAMGVRD